MPNSDITPESWEVARAYSKMFGAIPSAFQTCIRTLRQNHLSNLQAGRSGADPKSLQLLMRMLQSKTLRACYYFSVATYYEEVLKNRKDMTMQDVIAPFSPGALASLLALIYLNKASRKLVKEGWEAHSRRIQESSEIGGRLGQAIPTLGFDASLFAGAMRHIAFSAVLAQKPRIYLEYKRHLKKAEIPYDYAWELETLGCTLGQIGSILLQHAGFGIPYADAFFQATSTKFEFPVAPEASAFRMVTVWSEGILHNCPIPRVHGEDEYAMEEYQMEALLQRAEEIRENGSKYSYLNRSKDDVSPLKTPQLFSIEEREKAAAQAAEEGKDDIDSLFGD